MSRTLRILGLAAQGFKSFRQDRAYTFPEGPGLYFLGGDNRLHPELGPNGVGKSSFWDALVWVFFGKTARGLKAGDVANWAREDLCTGTVDFALGAKTYNVTRTWGPNTLTLQEGDGEPVGVSQDELEKVLACDFDTFLHTVLMSQFGDFFFDRGATDKLNLFSSIFDLTYWLERAKHAAAQAREHEQEEADLERELARLDGAIEAQEEMLAKARERSEAFSVEHESNLIRLERDAQEAEQELEQATVKAAAARQRLVKHEGQFTDAKRALIKSDDALRDKYQPKARDAKQAVQRARDRVDHLLNEIDRIEEMGAGECPTCYSQVGQDHIERVCETLADKSADLERAWEEAKQHYAKRQRMLDRALARRRKAEEAYNAAEQRVQRSRRASQQASRAQDAWSTEARAAQAALSKGRDEVDPHRAQVEDGQQRLGVLRKGRKHVARKRTKVSRAKNRAQYWAKRFKDLRLWLIERVLLDYEVTVNNSLVDLGLNGWKVTFAVEKPTKAGGVSKGFSVFIQSPESYEPVRWESWSGGETQRLRIAGALGLADLIRSRKGFDCSLEVWDEPTQHLSAAGVDDLLRYFKGRAREQGKQLWLVDHQTLSAGDFDGAALVILDELGTRVRAES